MTVVAERTHVMDVAAMLRMVEQAMRDRSWEQSPIGADVRAYLRALRWRSDSTNTYVANEHVLGLLALRHADWEEGSEGFCNPAGPEYLREFLDAEWGGAAAATKRQRASILRSFFRWLATEKRITFDPSGNLRGPKGRTRAARQAYPLEVLHQLVTAQETFRDQCALQLLCRLGLRKDELRRLRYRDIDLVRGYVLVHGKGGKDELLPLIGSLADDLRLLWAEMRLRCQAQGGRLTQRVVIISDVSRRRMRHGSKLRLAPWRLDCPSRTRRRSRPRRGSQPSVRVFSVGRQETAQQQAAGRGPRPRHPRRRAPWRAET